MKTQLILLFGVAGLLAVQNISAQSVLVNSWENSTEGWGVQQAAFQSDGFSTTLGVTDGTYSWAIGATSANTSTGPNYANMLGGTASVGNTALLANATSVSFDIYAPAGSFGGFLQFDLAYNNSILGYNSVNGYSYLGISPDGAEHTITFAITPALNASFAANPSSTTSFNIQIGGGFSSPATEVFNIDNLRVMEVPEPGTLALAGLGTAGLILFRRRHS